MEDERLNSQTIIVLLNQRLEKQQPGKISMILDHARYYHSQIVADFLTGHPPIVLKFIPPDWPNLNIIERGWKILKKKVVDNKFYLKLDDVRKNVLGFLENQSGPEKEFQHIWTDNFQIIQPKFSVSYLNWV